MTGKTKKQALASARNQSKSKCNAENRACVWMSTVTDQYHENGKYYVSVLGYDRSLNIGGKKLVTCYRNGKRI